MRQGKRGTYGQAQEECLDPHCSHTSLGLIKWLSVCPKEDYLSWWPPGGESGPSGHESKSIQRLISWRNVMLKGKKIEFPVLVLRYRNSSRGYYSVYNLRRTSEFSF